MSMTATFQDLFLISLPVRLLKRSVMTDVFSTAHQFQKRALIYFKTEPFVSKRLRNAYTHTNNSEIFLIAKLLHHHGFAVDMVDRTATWEEVEPLKDFNYTFYLGNAAGNSAPLHARITREFRIAKRVFFAAGPEPELSNELVNAQHEAFRKRHSRECVTRRLVKGWNFEERFENVDSIFYIGNEFSEKSYQKFSLPLHRIYPSSSPNLSFSLTELQKKKKNTFLFVGGTGLICKGLDLLLDAFENLPELELHICGPANEDDVWSFYKPLLKKNPNIHFWGWVKVGSPLFKEISEKSGFCILPSSAEGCATSVVTSMRKGSIPIVTYESGIDTGDFGYLIPDRSPQALRAQLLSLTNLPDPEFRQRCVKTYLASSVYSKESFIDSFERALLTVISGET